jgi:hypothetical protein
LTLTENSAAKPGSGEGGMTAALQRIWSELSSALFFENRKLGSTWTEQMESGYRQSYMLISSILKKDAL